VTANLSLRDMFAGAGGSSTGAADVPGVEVAHALNHWKKAVDVHNANHPDADHTCADISQVDPRYFPATDLLWASPECTNHSQAKGRKRENAQPDLFGETLPDEAAERSRATMWDVPRFTEAHRYKAVIVENVVDARHWLPFRAWLMAMDSYGYDHHIVYLNSMHAQAGGLPAPQSRDRMYVVFWRKGDRRPDFERMQRPKAWCSTCAELVDAMQVWKNPQKRHGRYRQQYVYRCPRVSCRNQIVEPAWLPAAAAIDWTIAGQRIGDRPKPLAEKTRRRIQAGIERYWMPIHLEAAGHTYDAADPKHPQFGDPGAYYRAWPVDEPLKVLHTIESKGVAYAPIMTPVEGRDGKEPRPATLPMRTQTTRNETGIAFPPFIAELRGGGSTARPVAHPMATVTAAGNHHGLVVPYYGAAESAKPDSEALGTLTTRDRFALVTRQNSSRVGDGAEMSTPVGEPLRTLTTMGHQSLTVGSVPDVDDCMFRMLEPHEVAAGMAFPGDYMWEGTRRERVRMAGNAVTPPAARDLVGIVAEAITGEAVA
jgi:DNA (cytosine-5)-methyltransferase 1